MVQPNNKAGFVQRFITEEFAPGSQAEALLAISSTIDFFRRRANQDSAATMKVLAQLVDGPRTGKELAPALGLDPSTVSRHVSTLESEGLIERTETTGDRRSQPIVATEAGRTALRAHFQQRVEPVAQVLARWPEADRTELARLLTSLMQGLSDH